MSVFRFRDFEFNTFERRLTRNGEWVDLTPKAMDILAVFVERPGELITRDEIIGSVWGNRLVEEGNLSVHISKLRKALVESREHRFIQTIAGEGYRFVATIYQTANGNHSSNPIHTPSGSYPRAARLLLKGDIFSRRPPAGTEMM